MTAPTPPTGRGSQRAATDRHDRATNDLFEEDLDLPDPTAQHRYAALVGLDHIKDRLLNEAELILQPKLLQDWSIRTHGAVLPALRCVAARPPLIIFAGDVGQERPPCPRPSRPRSRVDTDRRVGETAEPARTR
jgi:hypothetical protein